MENKHTDYDLKQMQSLPLKAKIRMSIERIKAYYEHFDGQVYVSFSGGKDSTVLLHLVRSVYPEVGGVYCDTGLEYPEIKEFVKKQENITIIKPKLSFREVVLKHGYPLPSKEVAKKIHYQKNGAEWTKKYFDGTAVDGEGRPSRYIVCEKWQKLLDAPFDVGSYCCDVMKKQPFKKYQKETGLVPILGTMAYESKLREYVWKRVGCNSFDSERPHSMPMSFWTENDVLTYIKENSLEYASVYGDIVDTGEKVELLGNSVPKYKTDGLDRTGCVFCMFGIAMEKHPNRFEKMKQTHPKLYEYCMKPIEEGGLGIDEVLNYVGIQH